MPVIHIALHKIIPLHPVLVRRQVRKLVKVVTPGFSSSSLQKSANLWPGTNPTGQSKYFPPIGFAAAAPDYGIG